MRLSVASRWLVVSCVALLAACGGGGGGIGGPAPPPSGGGGDGDPGTTSSGTSMSLQAFNTTMTVTQYASDDLVVVGTLASRPGTGALYIDIEDSDSAFSLSLLSGDGLDFTTTLEPGKWLKPGHHDGTLTFRLCQSPDCSVNFPDYTTTVPYSVTVNPPPGEEHRLLPSALAVAFADTPNGSVLSRTLRIHDNFGASTPWSATTDAAWLTVTPSGTSDSSSLVLSANPALLPLGQTSVATVQVSGAGITGATIQVGVWRDADNAPQWRVAPELASTNLAGIARDPYRPLIYVTVGTDQVMVYNAHTATLDRTIELAGTLLGTLAVAPDGGHLYVRDGQSGGAIRVVDLASDTVVSTWTPTYESGQALLVVHPNNEDIVLIADGQAMAHGATIVPLPPAATQVSTLSGRMTATDDGQVVYTAGGGSGPFVPIQLSSWLVDYSSGTGYLLEMQARSTAFNEYEFSGGQVAVSGDGDRLYFQDSLANSCNQIDPVSLGVIESFPHPGGGYALGVATGAAGDAACYYAGDTLVNDVDFSVFSPGGAAVSAIAVPVVNGNGSGSALITSSDGLVAVDGVIGAGLVFVPMGAPSSTGSAQTAALRTRRR